MSSQNNMLQEIKEAKLPDVKTTVTATFQLSFVQLLEGLMQQAMSGKVSYATYYQSLENMKITLEFFSNLVVEEIDERENRNKR